MGVKVCKWIQKPFTEEEVVDAHKQFDGDKAPAPDGFNMSVKKRLDHCQDGYK